MASVFCFDLFMTKGYSPPAIPASLDQDTELAIALNVFAVQKSMD